MSNENELLERVKKATVPIFIKKDDGVLFRGTGFFLGKENQLVTARHVLCPENSKEKEEFFIGIMNGNEYQLVKIIDEIDCSERNDDVYAIELSNYSHDEYFKISDSNPVVGDKVFLFGYYIKEENKNEVILIKNKKTTIELEETYFQNINCDFIANTKEKSKGALFVHKQTRKGNSGGPVIDFNCEVKGMIIGDIEIPNGWGVFLDSNILSRYLFH